MRRVLLGFSVGIAISCGCAADQYVYRPTEQATATTDGYLTARYPVPPEQPRGEVYVTSFGPTQAEVVKGQKTDLLQVRLSVNNNNAPGPWTLDTREQLALIPGQGQSRPAYVNTSAASSPLISIQPGGRQVIDLYYVLPAGFAPKHLTGFELLWKVQTDAQRVVAERTPFARLKLEPPEPAYYPPSLALGLGWGPYWWYDPYYPTATFYHPIVMHPPRPVFVHQPTYIHPAPHTTVGRPPGIQQPPAPVWRATPPGAVPRSFQGAPGGVHRR